MKLFIATTANHYYDDGVKLCVAETEAEAETLFRLIGSKGSVLAVPSLEDVPGPARIIDPFFEPPDDPYKEDHDGAQFETDED
jgi:hypothetical protein